MAWITPKTNWASPDGVSNVDMNRIEGNIKDLHEPKLVVTCDASMVGQTVTLTKGATVLSKVIPAGLTVTFEVSTLGDWILHNPATNTDKTISLNLYGYHYETLKAYKKYTAYIDTTNPNSVSAVTYADDAVGMTPGSSIFDDFFGARPCLFVAGARVKYLNPDNFAQDVNGNPVDIVTLGNDVMIEFPKRGYRINAPSSSQLVVSVTDEPFKAGYYYYAFSKNAEGDSNYFYLGAYDGYFSNNQVYSSSNKTPTGATFANVLSWCRARGVGYNPMGWYQLMYIQILFVLKYKSIDSQAALGYGYTNTGAVTASGTGNTKGMNYGNKVNYTDVVKFLGLENIWGNIGKWAAGVNTTGGMSFVTAFLPSLFSATDFGAYMNHGVLGTINQNYMSKASGGMHGGFVAIQVLGSATTYFADQAYIAASGFFYFGGGRLGTTSSGLFTQYTASNSATDATTRLMFI